MRTTLPHSLPFRSLVLIAVGLVAGLFWRGEGPVTFSSTVESTTVDFGAGADGMVSLEMLADGQTDATAALQALIDAETGAIQLPRGTYRLTHPLRVDLSTVGWTSFQGRGVVRLKMDGPGPALQIEGTHAGTADPATFADAVWDRERMPLVDGLEIVGTHPEADGIIVRGTMQFTLSRTHIRDVRHAVRLIERNRNVTLSECHLYENAGVGLFLDGVNLHQINVANCHISYNRGGGIVARGSEIRNLQIGTCDIEGNMGGPDNLSAANIDLDARGTSLGEVAIVGCTIQHSHTPDDSYNIRINGDSLPRPFTEETRHGHITIADNVLSDVQTNIELRHVRGATITGNTVWKGYTRNVALIDCRNIVLANNVFDRNPRYGYGDGNSARLGLLVEQCQGVLINANLFCGSVGHPAVLTCQNSARIQILGCQFAEFNAAAIHFDHITDGQIANCSFFPAEQNGATAITIIDSERIARSDNLN